MAIACALALREDDDDILEERGVLMLGDETLVLLKILDEVSRTRECLFCDSCDDAICVIAVLQEGWSLSYRFLSSDHASEYVFSVSWVDDRASRVTSDSAGIV